MTSDRPRSPAGADGSEWIELVRTGFTGLQGIKLRLAEEGIPVRVERAGGWGRHRILVKLGDYYEAGFVMACFAFEGPATRRAPAQELLPSRRGKAGARMAAGFLLVSLTAGLVAGALTPPDPAACPFVRAAAACNQVTH